MTSLGADHPKKDNNLYLRDFADFQGRIRSVFPDAAIDYSDTNMVGSTFILSARVGTKAAAIHAPGAAGRRYWSHGDPTFIIWSGSGSKRTSEDKHEAVEILIELLKEG
jgi:hypothetical protein